MFFLINIFVCASDDQLKDMDRRLIEIRQGVNDLQRMVDCFCTQGYIAPFIMNEQRQVLLSLEKNSDIWINGSQQYGHDYQNYKINLNICNMMRESTGINISEVKFLKKIDGTHRSIREDRMVPCWYYILAAKGFYQQARLLRPDAYQEQSWFDIDNLPHNMLLNRHELSQALQEYCESQAD